MQEGIKISNMRKH